jgi:Kef-type K+ transport system membrane component KefB
MTATIIIALSILLLLAYFFDLTSSKTRIPSVILLLMLGWAIKQATIAVDMVLPDFSGILPILGTIGLILIVLEGSLDLEFNRSKVITLRRSFFGATFSIVALCLSMVAYFHFLGPYSLRDSLINALPLCVISSAIAIPSARNMPAHDREFVVYESSLSDILGVVLFNFVIINTVFDAGAFLNFGLDMLIMAIVSFVATIGLALLMRTIKAHVKFIPIILLVILIYEFSKLYHLPSLLFILIFGLFIGNLDELKGIKWIKQFRVEELDKEVDKFKELTGEATFLIRSLFFLLFGFLLELGDILNSETIAWSVGSVILILLVRIIQLKVTGIPLVPLVFLAPRGLITILLFLTIPAASKIPIINNALVTQVIILTALVMTVGAIAASKTREVAPAVVSPEPEKTNGIKTEA